MTAARVVGRQDRAAPLQHSGIMAAGRQGGTVEARPQHSCDRASAAQLLRHKAQLRQQRRQRGTAEAGGTAAQPRQGGNEAPVERWGYGGARARKERHPQSEMEILERAEAMCQEGIRRHSSEVADAAPHEWPWRAGRVS